jgi:hypothetical protein
LIADDNCWKFGFEIHPCLRAQAKRANGRIIYLDEKGFSLYLLNAGKSAGQIFDLSSCRLLTFNRNDSYPVASSSDHEQRKASSDDKRASGPVSFGTHVNLDIRAEKKIHQQFRFRGGTLL